MKIRGYSESSFDSSLKVSRYFVPSTEGVQLETIWIENDRAEANVIFFLGKGGNTSFYYPFLQEMALTARANIFAINVRGYGQSSGQPTLRGILDDVVATCEYFQNSIQHGNAGTYVCGFSTGCFYALYAADKFNYIKGSILLAPFTTARQQIEKVRHDFQLLDFFLNISISNSVDSIDNVKLVEKSERPLLLIHGAIDELNSPEMSMMLYERSASTKKSIHLINGSGHDSLTLNSIYFKEVAKLVRDFLSDDR